MDKSKIGAALNALRETHWHYCAEPSCGKRFSGIKLAKFCSNACRQRAKYTKAKAARVKPPEP
jgi:hypothetical protein